MSRERGWVQTELGWVELEQPPAQVSQPLTLTSLTRTAIVPITAGIDEAGRGPLAGPVYAAAVVLDARHPIDGLADSKVLKESVRDALAVLIRSRARAWFVARATVEEIDTLNILNATMLAMRRAVEGLGMQVDVAEIDGNRAPSLSCSVRTVIGGDALVPAISAASILAKTARDAELVQLHDTYPVYGFDRHKGYGTAVHLRCLFEHGPCPEHRRSFEPVRRALENR